MARQPTFSKVLEQYLLVSVAEDTLTVYQSHSPLASRLKSICLCLLLRIPSLCITATNLKPAA
jgi:hypothetical protein